MPAVQLGPFVLQRPVGKGGMAEVWRGYHVDQQVPVAVKVMTAAVFAKPENIDRFENEVRAVARLDHPGIVYVFDHGQIPEAAAQASRGRLAEGAPYLAMEFASGGSLADPNAVPDWRVFRGILLGLLDALAHAHAHNVVHRDIKPANVLLGGPADLRPGVKLTDFGIAMAETVQDKVDEVVGTLHYMSPEQIRASPWMQGPHTDLYALGCLAWRIACGRLPFDGRRGVSLLAAQLHQPLPELTPVIGVPVLFGEWLKALTAKHPGDRFRRAADAATALEQLGEPEGTPIPAPSRFLPIEEQPTVLDLSALKSQSQLDPDSTPIARYRSPVSSDWRRTGVVLPNIQLMGAGLGLFGVRSVPLVGREPERDSIWGALRQVHRTGQARAILIRGAAGCGKSRLASWICSRAHEIGSATILTARFNESGAAEAPLRRMLERALRPPELEEERAEFGPYWLEFWGSSRMGIGEALEAVLDPPATLDAESRHALLRLLVEEIARERPVVIWLDDVQWGMDGLRFAHSVLNSQAVRPLPILLLMTARDEALAIREQEQGRLQELMTHPHSTTVPLRPLDRRDRSKLVQQLLLLEPSLGAAVEERSAGNPLFAVQLVGDWVQRGVLVPSERGFELAEGTRPNLPDDLAQVWTKRVEQVLEGLPESAGWMLETAAVLGAEVDDLEWRTVCDNPEQGLRSLNPIQEAVRREVLQLLLAGRLAERNDSGWMFAHGLLQESLQERARKNGRWESLNRAAARMLEHRSSATAAERLGQHLLEAGEVQAAIQPLLKGAQHRRVSVGRRSALRLLRQCEVAMRTLPPSAPEWAQLWEEKAITLYLLGQLEESRAVANQMLAGSLDHGWRDAEPRGAFRLGRIAHDSGDLANAAKWLELARELADDGTLRAEACFHLSRVVYAMLQPERARDLQAEATRLLAGTEDRRLKSLTAIYLSESAWDDGDMEACGKHAEDALQLAAALSDLGLQVRAWNFMAESSRARGDLDLAAAQLGQGISIADMVGHNRAPILRGNLGLVHLAAHDYDRAAQVLQAAYFQAEQMAQPPLLAVLRALLVEATAGQQNWVAFDDHTTAAERFQYDLQFGEPDCAAALERAASKALAAGDPRRAHRAAALSADHFAKLGKLDRRRQVLARYPLPG